ncbi:MAG: DUF3352 domain-containing protein [Planctomycetota bacterium]|nr:DUF3352 domain-containing protein [Planctomycetota bacterium]
MKHNVMTGHQNTIRISNLGFVFCLFASLLLLSVGVQAVPLASTAKLVPAETVVLIDVENFNQMKAQFEKTNLYKLYKDPAMAAFFADARAKCREKIQKLDGNNILKVLYDSDILPQGRVAMAVVLNQETKDANALPVLFITQWGENIDKIKEVVNKMVQKNTELGGHQKSSEDYRGINIETLVDETSATFNYCFIDDCLIGSMNSEILKFTIAHIKGATSPTLADDSDYTSATGIVGSYREITWYINIKQFIKMAATEDTTGKTMTTIANLGLDNVVAFAGSIGESDAVKAQQFAPASTYSMAYFNLDPKKIYTELYNILYSFSPGYAAMLNAMDLPDSLDGEPGVKLKSGVIDNLGSQIIVAQSINKPFSATSVPTESLVALAVNNRSALEKSVSLIHSKMIAPNNPDAKRELLGHTIYLVKTQGLPFARPGKTPMDATPQGPTAAPVMPTLAFTITDTHIIFGTEAAVEKAIRTMSSGSETPLSSAKWFSATRTVIPSSVGMAGLEDNSASSELFWWMAKQTGKAPSMMPMQFGQQGLSDLINPSLLPEFDAVRKYFGFSAFYGISKPDGFFFELRDIAQPVADSKK